MWGFALWALAHIAPNGDGKSIIFFGEFVVLAIVGMFHINYRRRETMDSDWVPIALTTSVIPFRALYPGAYGDRLEGNRHCAARNGNRALYPFSNGPRMGLRRLGDAGWVSGAIYFSRFCASLSRSAFSLMKPSASRWS